jgi:hypothetical protein
MSTDALSHAQQAHQLLREQVFNQVYFAKLAELGRQPRSEPEAEGYLKIAFQALSAREQGLYAPAGPQADPHAEAIKRASLRLERALAGVPAHESEEDRLARQEDEWCKAAAAHFFDQAPVQEAVTIWQASLADAGAAPAAPARQAA